MELLSEILSISEPAVFVEGDTASLTCSFSNFAEITVQIAIMKRTSTFENPDTYATGSLAASGVLHLFLKNISLKSFIF